MHGAFARSVRKVKAVRKQTLLVIDDQKDFRELVQRTLEREGYDCILAADGVSGLRIAEQHRPDLVILDLSMPDLDGLEVRRCLRDDPAPPGASHPHAVGTGERAGARSRPGNRGGRLSGQALCRRGAGGAGEGNSLRQLADGRPGGDSRGNLEIDLRGHTAAVGGKPIALTAAQFRILEFIALHPGRAFSRDEIIESCLRDDIDVTERTVDAHIVGIRKALGHAVRHIETVRTIGYKFVLDC